MIYGSSRQLVFTRTRSSRWQWNLNTPSGFGIQRAANRGALWDMKMLSPTLHSQQTVVASYLVHSITPSDAGTATLPASSKSRDWRRAPRAILRLWKEHLAGWTNMRTSRLNDLSVPHRFSLPVTTGS